MYEFFLEITVLSRSNNLEKSGMLAILPLSPSLETCFTTFTMLWTHLLQKLSF